MMRLRWTRTLLCAIGFVLVLLEWHLINQREHAQQVHVEELIARVCVRQVLQRDSDMCEVRMRSHGLGSGNSMSGSIDVSGSVDVNGSVDVQ